MPEQKRFVVEGRYLDPEDGSITEDWILAKSKQQAVEQATKTREHNCNGWDLDRVSTFDEYIAEQERIIAQMRATTDVEVAKSWAETKSYLMGDEE